MKKRIYQKDPNQLKPDDIDYCHHCGHYMDYRIYTKKEITRSIFEHICKFCQRETPDPNPQRTQRIN